MQVLCALVILGRMRRGNVGRPLYLSYLHFDARYERYDRLTVLVWAYWVAVNIHLVCLSG
jgi:hypothetical protein